ncbi:5-methylcytosine-specific restriction protein B [Evansella vedderi]|uniref:5-methylcytosine-specific restriction protein B n=1 Tax=Evansella vedderi TaxID=38282 RepID=A0ABU0A2N4_9BACI|nr:AAA family ATPase [Evansella vedderi]MDQ0257510.1 5-methylcytosine-specific restriction protein B [Evansella vedderi]
MKTVNPTTSSFTWTAFYMEFADKLLQYKNKRPELLNMLEEVYGDLGIRYPFIENDQPIDDICPFTVLGSFNKGITNENRIVIAKEISNRIGVDASVPTDFDGIPVLNNMRAWFFASKDRRKADDIPNLWNVFETGIQYADHPSEDTKKKFTDIYEKVRKQRGVKWNLTMGLYWIRPFFYLNLDERNRTYLLQKNSPYSNDITEISKLKDLPNTNDYLKLINYFKDKFQIEEFPHQSFPELSFAAWKSPSPKEVDDKKSNASFLKWFVPLINALKALGGSGTPAEVRQQIASDLNLTGEFLGETRGKSGVKKFDNEVAFARNYLVYEGYIDNSIRGTWSLTEIGRTADMNDDIASDIFLKWTDKMKLQRDEDSSSPSDVVNEKEKRYWIYSPGQNASQWEKFYSQGVMGIGWDELGDLSQFSSKQKMKVKMKELYGQEYTYMNAAHATWQFANEILPGDTVYVKKGTSTVIGKGIVESEYMYDPTRDEYKHIHKVNWVENGEWDHPGKAVNKTLTDITPYTDYVRKLENLFIDEDDEDIEEIEVDYDPYTKEDFLNEVFIPENRYHKIVNLLKKKKNVILQGPPGVGKTFAAKRIAYSIMGEKDVDRVMMVQFHQSYSYEDFIMGYRPTNNGFELSEGPFYEFCKKAEKDNDRDYFFIIDEINRGNLSKIFGELLMLIENDKRGQKLRLLYANELFSVPKNVYILGMMNTADRSLAMIDYALRRRFAFYKLEAAFDSDGFLEIMNQENNSKFTALVEQIKALNNYISEDESLGSGFQIGHSFLCSDEEVTDEWMSSVIEYELIPLLDEYWFDEPSKVELWTNRLRGVLND